MKRGRRSWSRPTSHSLCVWGPASLIIAVAVAGSLHWRSRPLLLWNASASSLVGLYALTSPAALRVGDMVVAWAPPAARQLAADRHYLPFRIPLVKRVGAVAGDRVCARGKTIFVDGHAAAQRSRRDPSGRRMPWWSGCRVLHPGEMFLLSVAGPLAFDGRYFGVTRASELVGKAQLLWAFPAKCRKHG